METVTEMRGLKGMESLEIIRNSRSEIGLGQTPTAENKQVWNQQVRYNASLTSLKLQRWIIEGMRNFKWLALHAQFMVWTYFVP